MNCPVTGYQDVTFAIGTLDAPGVQHSTEDMYRIRSRRAHSDAKDFLSAAESAFVSRLSLPAMVNVALAAELAIKSLLLDELGREERGHLLLELLNKLSAEVRAEIERRCVERLPATVDSFTDLLDVESDAFISWRYANERTSLVGHYGFLRTFAQTVLDVADLRFSN